MVVGEFRWREQCVRRLWGGKRQVDFEEQREGQGGWSTESKARMTQNALGGDAGIRT